MISVLQELNMQFEYNQCLTVDIYWGGVFVHVLCTVFILLCVIICSCPWKTPAVIHNVE